MYEKTHRFHRAGTRSRPEASLLRRRPGLAAPGNILERAYRAALPRIAGGGDLRVAHRASLSSDAVQTTAGYTPLPTLPPQPSALAQAQRLEAEPPTRLRDASGASVDSGPSLTPPASSEKNMSDRPEAELPDWLKGLQESDQALPSSAASIPAWPDGIVQAQRRRGRCRLARVQIRGWGAGLSGSESFKSAPEASDRVQRGFPEQAPESNAELHWGPVPVVAPDQAAAAALAKSPVPPVTPVGRRDDDRARRPVARLATLVPN